MNTAPRNATTIQVRMANGQVHPDCHWACDLSGEDQPPFKGWFVPVTDHEGKVIRYNQIATPRAWKPVKP